MSAASPSVAPDFAVIIAAAGRSTRFGDASLKKPFQLLAGVPVWVWAARKFRSRADVAQLLITISPEELNWFRQRFAAEMASLNVEPVAGGVERADSVASALQRVRSECVFVAVHDAARPLTPSEEIDAVFQAARGTGAAIPATPVANTLKRVDGGLITETVPRAGLWGALTPQAFRTDLLRQAYAARGSFSATDDAQLVERLPHAVAVVPGAAINFKITTLADLELAEAILRGQGAPAISSSAT